MRLILLLALLTTATIVPQAFADEVYTFVVKKQEDKAKTRWTLSDWLETRDRMRMQDLWLAIHSPTPYEFFVSGAYTIPGTQPFGGPSSGSDFAAAAFATIFGLEGRRDTIPNTRWLAMFDLRIFGYHDQSTNITLQTGLVSQDAGGGSIRNPLAGARMDIYLARFFGIGGLYRHYFDGTPNVLGGNDTFSGSRYEGQAFIDFQFLRVYGMYFYDGNMPFGEHASGIDLGLKLYF
jgi:hypothetical protein